MAARSHITGMKGCRESLQQLSRAVQRGIGKRALQAPAGVIAAAVKSRAPVSGRGNNPSRGSLRDSVKVAAARAEKGRPTVVVLADDVAAVPNEFGTSSMAAQPFFRPAVDAVREQAGAAMANALKSEVDAAVVRAAKRAAKG